MSHQPIEAKHYDAMNKLGREINNVFNKDVKPYHTGFMLLVFDLNEHEGRMNYISNARREDMLVAMKEFIANVEGRVTDETGHA